jgi:hypothetical protein
MFRVAKIQIDFDATERCGDLIDNSRNEFLEIESGGDALRKFLQAHQFRHPESGGLRQMLVGQAEICERAGGHD